MSDMRLHGNLRKMRIAHGGSAPTGPGAAEADYAMVTADAELPLNALVGARIRITHSGAIHCTACGRKTKKSFSQGHCWPCSQRLASCDTCIIKPELCHYHAGTCREPQWGEANCLRPHVVYLANSSGLKVGITRGTQVPTRWLDQGAVQALPLFDVDSRLLAGRVEVALARHVADKTDWRAMLRGAPPVLDLTECAQWLLEQASADLALASVDGGTAVRREAAAPFEVAYPVARYPDKVRSQTLDKLGVIEGVLDGIKGQYLLFDSGVMNVRRHSGYEVSVEVL